MPYTVVQLGPVTFSSAGTSVELKGKVDDAQNISLIQTTTSTSAMTIQVEMTDTGANWFPLTLPFIITSSGGASNAIFVTSSYLTIISNIAYTRMRLVSTGSVVQVTSFSAAKQILV